MHIEGKASRRTIYRKTNTPAQNPYPETTTTTSFYIKTTCVLFNLTIILCQHKHNYLKFYQQMHNIPFN